MILTDAVDNRMIPINPCQNLRLAGRDDRTSPVVRRRRVITDTQALHVARLAGLARDNCHTSNGIILIDPEVGALHEVGGRIWLGLPRARLAGVPPYAGRRTAGLRPLPRGHDCFGGAVGAQ